jgi:CheY-like chemotaxis protein
MASPVLLDNPIDLPSPASQIDIPLPKRKDPPWVVIADDEEDVIQALQRSLENRYHGALDVRFWRPGTGPNLVENVKSWIKAGWPPDAVVIDINFDEGGKHGVHYLEDLRKEHGCAALAVVLVTGNQYSDLEQGHVSRLLKNSIYDAR